MNGTIKEIHQNENFTEMPQNETSNINCFFVADTDRYRYKTCIKLFQTYKIMGPSYNSHFCIYI